MEVFSLKQIVNKEAENIAPCVYYAHFQTKLLYIGKTKVSLPTRIFGHIKDKNSKLGAEIRLHIGFVELPGWFDTTYWNVLHPERLKDWFFAAVVVPLECLDREEQIAISYHNPPLNVQYTSRWRYQIRGF